MTPLPAVLIILAASDCSVTFNPTVHDPDVNAALVAVSNALKVPETTLRALMVSKCDENRVMVKIIRNDVDADLLQPWIARKKSGKWAVIRNTE